MSPPPLPHTSPFFGSTSSWKLLLQGCFPACASPHCSLGMQMLVLPSCPTASPVQAGREGAPAGGWEPGTSPFQPPGKGERAALYPCTPARSPPGLSQSLPRLWQGVGFFLPLWDHQHPASAQASSILASLPAVEAGVNRAWGGGMHVPAPGSPSLLCCLS